ncbi:LysR substrate-binding domain-containing protein [Croceicoccus pelagius]|nr:LysR substrate-binding domain-containing protein [Croceicoccus pelagius]
MKFSLRHLEIFVAVARAGSISAAATELSMSQSAASTALIELERRYGRSLFDRAGKRLKINETGRSLLVPALELLSRAVEIDELLAGRAGPGPLRLGATQTIGNYIAPRLISAYCQRHEGSTPTLEISNTAEIAARIVDFSLDLALVEGAYEHPDLVLTDWLHDELILICGSSHHLAGREAWSIDDVLAERWVVREKGSGTRQTLDTAIRPHLSRWRIGMELQQIEAILEMAAVSPLIGCVPRVAAQHLISQGRLVEIKVPELDLQRRFYIMTHKARYFTAGIRAFLKICEGA